MWQYNIFHSQYDPRKCFDVALDPKVYMSVKHRFQSQRKEWASGENYWENREKETFFIQMASWRQCLKSVENSATAMLELILTSSTYQLALTHSKTNWNEGQRYHAKLKHPSPKQKLNHTYGKRLSFSPSHSVLKTPASLLPSARVLPE